MATKVNTTQCDLIKPSCKRCIRSGRPCEGYARHTIFGDVAVGGRANRHTCQEAKHLKSMQLERSLLSISKHRIPLQLSNVTVLDDQLLSAFWEYYSPAYKTVQGVSSHDWLQKAISLKCRPDALNLSLKALAMTRLGSLYKDSALVYNGRVIYSRALTEFHKALSNQRELYQDDILAAGYVLAVYEVCYQIRGLRVTF